MTEIFAQRHLDERGRCCGRKPLFYRTRRGMGTIRDPHYFCTRCDAEFGADGIQRANWAWLAVDEGFVPKYPDHPYAKERRT